MIQSRSKKQVHGPTSLAPSMSQSAFSAVDPDITASPGWATDMQDLIGNSAVRDIVLQQRRPPDPTENSAGGTLAEKIPESMDLVQAGVAFSLPGGIDLTGDWNQVCTREETRVRLEITEQQFEIQFSPALLVDLQFPLHNVEWTGLTYDFTKGALTEVALEGSSAAIARTGIVQFVNDLVRGTRLAKSGYSPLTDPDLAGTYAALQQNFKGDGQSEGDGGDVQPKDISRVTTSATVTLNEAVTMSTSEGGIEIPAGGSITIHAHLHGDGASLLAGGIPSISFLEITSTNLILKSGDQPIAKLLQVFIGRGGRVDVKDFEALGDLRRVRDGFSTLFALLAYGALQSTHDLRYAGADTTPYNLDEAAAAKMEQALTDAFVKAIQTHWDVIPGLDLRNVLGIPPSQEDETPGSAGGSGSSGAS